MTEPDVRVDPAALDRAGAVLARTGAAIGSTARASSALAPEPAWSDGFASVGATARVGAAWRVALERTAADVEASGAAMRASAAGWEAADRAAADSMR